MVPYRHVYSIYSTSVMYIIPVCTIETQDMFYVSSRAVFLSYAGPLPGTFWCVAPPLT